MLMISAILNKQFMLKQKKNIHKSEVLNCNAVIYFEQNGLLLEFEFNVFIRFKFRYLWKMIKYSYFQLCE